MSILIKSMKMPAEPMVLILHPDGNISTEEYEIGANAKAIELPPHGRLIDVDELKKFPIRRDHYDKDHGDEHFINGIETVMEFIDYAPTVIEAEEAEE